MLLFRDGGGGGRHGGPLVDADTVGGLGKGHDGIVVGEDVGLGKAEFVVEDVEELPLDAADVPLAKDPCAARPVDVLQGGVVTVLQGKRIVSTRARKEDRI